MRYTARRATPDDLSVIQALLSDGDKLVLHGERDRVPHEQGFYLVQADGTSVGACGVTIGPQTVAQIRAFALGPDCPLSEALGALLRVAVVDLPAQGVATLAFIGIEEWLTAGLAAQGFQLENTIVTMQKTDFDVPDWGNLSIDVRPAQHDDLAAVLAIDDAVFEPLWRSTEETLTGYLAESPRFCVASHDWTVVGYQCLSLVGRHGHITRIAVHPRFQGKRVAVRLLADAVSFYQDRRVYGITLNTQQDNHRARRLYEWFGFSVLGREAHVMVLELPCTAPESQV